MTPEELFSYALDASQKAYAPYSHFRVGAALLCEDGSVITGVNVENRSFGLTICAERSAITTAVTQGKQRFKALAIATPDASYPVSPCGACRQVLSEFTSGDFPVYFGHEQAKLVATTMDKLFPHDALHELKNN